MRLIATREAQMKFKRSYDKTNTWAHVYVTESATNYYVTIRVMGYVLPSVQDWKISKKDANNMLHAANLIADEAYRRGNL